MQRTKSGNRLVAAGVVIFGLSMAAFPLYYTRSGPNVSPHPQGHGLRGPTSLSRGASSLPAIRWLC